MFGLLYARGLHGANLHEAQQLWTAEWSPVYAATMSIQRFKFLLSHIRFDDINLREEACSHDKFAPAREIFELFNAACTKALQCGPELAFDETLYANFGRGFGFKQYMKAKPSKYGMLYRSLNDAQVPYTYTSHVYAGKPASTPTENYIVGVEETVLNALNRYGAVHELKGRNITFDRFYTNIDLADKLLEDFEMTCVGTLTASRKGLPEKFKALAGREEKDYMPLFEVDGKKSIHSWITNTKSGPKNVMVLTTTVPLMGTTKDDEKDKPAIMKR